MFCDYCNCSICQNGSRYMWHSETVTGTWICDCCYEHDICVSESRKITGKALGPCVEFDCEHRPKLVGEWIAYDANT